MKNRQRTRGWHIELKPVLGAIGLVVVLATAGCVAGGTRNSDRSGDELLAALNAGAQSDSAGRGSDRFRDRWTHLNDIWNRKTDVTQQYWTLPIVPASGWPPRRLSC